MSSEDQLVKQLESIISSVIKALEGLEKEFSEYIEATNKRLQILEDKVQKIESLADVKSKGGLVKAIESSSNMEQVKPLVHLSQQHRATTPTVQQEQTQPRRTETPVLPSAQQKIPAVQRPDTTQLPPIPKPPSFDATLRTESTSSSLVRRQQQTTTSIKAPSTLQQQKKEMKPQQAKEKEDNDKEELMSALKVIDSL